MPLFARDGDYAYGCHRNDGGDEEPAVSGDEPQRQGEQRIAEIDRVAAEAEGTAGDEVAGAAAVEHCRLPLHQRSHRPDVEGHRQHGDGETEGWQDERNRRGDRRQFRDAAGQHGGQDARQIEHRWPGISQWLRTVGIH